MKEIEEQILARKDELNAAAPKKDKKAKEDAPAAEAKSESGEAAENEDVLANFDEDFEEFTPAEE